MVIFRPAPVQPPPHYPRAALLEWIRGHAPDLRIAYRLEGETRVVGARYTFRGVEHKHFLSSGRQPDGTVVENIDDAIVQHIYRVLARELALPHVAGPSRTDRERAIVAAAARGDTQTAEALSRELATSNETETRRRHQVRTQFGNRATW